MKKTVLIVAMTAFALGALGVGTTFAQGGQPPYGPIMMHNGGGYLHTYMVKAFAEKLGLKVEDVNARLAAGETMYTIAIVNGLKTGDFAALMTEVGSQALDAAVQDGVITQAQADRMLQRMQDRSGYGYGPGNCPLYNGQGAQFGPQGWRGNMMTGRGWRNQRTNP